MKKDVADSRREGPLAKLFTGNATAKMLDFLVDYQEFDYSESDIARQSGVSIRHAMRTMRMLEELQLVRLRPSGRSKLYMLNKESKQGQMLERFVLSLAKAENDKIVKEELEEEKKTPMNVVS